MAHAINLTGQRFERLVVIEQAGRLDANVLWKCKCDCGNGAVVRSNCLRRGVTKSCGCLQKEGASRREKTHGMTNTKEFSAWSSMWGRCSNPKHKGYKNYGARGIAVCERWNEFTAFYEDMGPRPPGLSLERVDNELGYSPENCVWADMRVQSANTRRVKNSSTGIVGVWKRGSTGKYRAAIRIHGALKHIGEFDSLEAAKAARKEAEKYLVPRKLSDNSNSEQQVVA